MMMRVLLCLFLCAFSSLAVAQDLDSLPREERERIIEEQHRAFEQEMMRQQQEEAAAEAASKITGGPQSPSQPQQRVIDNSVAPRLPEVLERRQRQMAVQPRFVDAWIRPAKIGDNSAAYMTIYGTTTPSVIKSVSSAWAKKVELHGTTTDDKGVMHMQALGDLAVAANSEVKLAPGGLHVMLLGLRRDIRPGQVVPLTFTLENGSTIRVIAKVRNPASAATQQPAPSTHQGH